MNGITSSLGNIRDYDYEVVCGTSEIVDNFPETFQLPALTIKDQGSFGACVGCALATILEGIYKEEFSEGWIYGRLRNEYSNSPGMVPVTTVDYLRTIGGIPKKLFDLLLEMPNMKEEVLKFPELDEKAKNYRISGYVRINPPGDRKNKDLQIKNALMNHPMPDGTKGSRLFAISPKGFAGGSHAIVLLGWDDTKDKYIFQNSWGENYGNDGVSKIDKSDISEVYLFLYEPIQLPFEDVNEEDWFFKVIKNCYMAGLIQGKSEKEFDPNGYITRAEVCALLDRYAKKDQQEHETLEKLISIKHEYNQL